jgi:hypothetical protein
MKGVRGGAEERVKTGVNRGVAVKAVLEEVLTTEKRAG